MKQEVGSGVGFGSEPESGSVSQRYGSGDPEPDPHKNVMDPKHCLASKKKFGFGLASKH